MAHLLAIRARLRRLFPRGASRPLTSAAGSGCRAISRPGSIGCAGSARANRRVRHSSQRSKAGTASFDLLRHPLLPYQREGMLHLAFGERALAGRRDGPRQDGPGDCRLRALGRPQGHRARAGGVPGLAQGGVGGADRPFHRPRGALRVRAPAGAPCRLPRARLLHHRELRAGARRRRRHQRTTASRRGHARRGAAHQELADQDGATR